MKNAFPPLKPTLSQRPQKPISTLNLSIISFSLLDKIYDLNKLRQLFTNLGHLKGKHHHIKTK